MDDVARQDAAPVEEAAAGARTPQELSREPSDMLGAGRAI